jgi:hypothetical protein
MPASHIRVVAVFSVATGIKDIKDDKDVHDLKAFVQNGTLHVSGLTAGQSWKVYNITGSLIYQGIATDSKAEFALPGRGVYIVTNGVKTVKAAY